MSDFRHAMKNGGYDQEEAYFYQKDRELIEKLKESQKTEGSPPQEGGQVIQLEIGKSNQALTQKKAA